MLHLWPYNEAILLVFFIPLLLPLVDRKANHLLINFPHIVERCQLITIITFGETVIAIIQNYPLTSHFFNGFLLFVGMSFLFMLYISQTYLNMEHHQEVTAGILMYAHIGIVLGVNLFTVGIEMLTGHHSKLGFWFFLIGLILFYLSLFSTSVYNQNLFRIGKRIWAQYLFTLALGALLLYLLRHHLLGIEMGLIILTYSMLHVTFRMRRAARQRAGIST